MSKKLKKEVLEKKIGENEYLRLFDLDNRKNSLIKEVKRVKYRNLEDIVYSLQVTYDEFIDILEVK